MKESEIWFKRVSKCYQKFWIKTKTHYVKRKLTMNVNDMQGLNLYLGTAQIKSPGKVIEIIRFYYFILSMFDETDLVS